MQLIKNILVQGCKDRQTDRKTKSALRSFVAKQNVNSFAIGIRRIIMEKKRLLTTQLHICTIWWWCWLFAICCRTQAHDYSLKRLFVVKYPVANYSGKWRGRMNKENGNGIWILTMCFANQCKNVLYKNGLKIIIINVSQYNRLVKKSWSCGIKFKILPLKL